MVSDVATDPKLSIFDNNKLFKIFDCFCWFRKCDFQKGKCKSNKTIWYFYEKSKVVKLLVGYGTKIKKYKRTFSMKNKDIQREILSN